MRNAILIACILLNINVLAQKIGIKGGATYTSVQADTPLGNLLGYQYHWGYQAGVLTEFQLNDRLIFQPNLSLTVKGAFVALTEDELDIYYVEMPVHVLYSFGRLQVGGGVYIAYTLSGAFKSKTLTTNLTFGNGLQDARRVDYGLSLVAQYTLENGFFLSANAGYGLGSVSNHPDQTMNNRMLGISLGYYFKLKVKR